MALSALLERWRTNPRIASNIAAWRTTPARAAQYVPFPDDVHPVLKDALRAAGMAVDADVYAAEARLAAARVEVIRSETAARQSLAPS